MKRVTKIVTYLFAMCMLIGIAAFIPNTTVKAANNLLPNQVFVAPGGSADVVFGTWNNVYVRDDGGTCQAFTAYYYNTDGTIHHTSESTKTQDSAYGNANYTVYADKYYNKAVCEVKDGKYIVHLYRPEEAAPAPEEPARDGGSCHHNYQWITDVEATNTVNAIMAYKCQSCGHVQDYMTEANSAFVKFNQETADSIRKAEANGTVTVDTNMWSSFHRTVFDELMRRTDVTLIVNYRYQGTLYTVTIPAGADLSTVVDENGYCGFRNLDAIFGGSQRVIK